MDKNEDKKVKQVCEECGSDRIVSKAWAKWDIDRQDWVLDDLWDIREEFCIDCDGETHTKAIEVNDG